MTAKAASTVYDAQIRLCAVLALACFLFAGCGRGGVTANASHSIIETLEFGGLTRSYILHRPLPR